MEAFPVEFFDMGRPRFVHLRMHSEYSVSDGIVRIDDAVRRAAEDHMAALALTDSGNLFGLVKFYGAARAAGVKPILGVDCWIESETERDKPARLLLLCTSRAGYRRLSAEPDHVRDVLRDGAKRARCHAADTVGRARAAIGLLPA